MLNKLYLRIWLAVLLAVTVLTLLVGWIWHLAAEPPLRDLVFRNEAGQIIGRSQPRLSRDERERRTSRELRELLRRYGPRRSAASEPALAAGLDGQQNQYVLTAISNVLNEMDALDASVRPANLPEFEVRMRDGQTLRIHLWRGPATFWSRPPFGFAWMLVWVGIAVALATYPIVRTLTRRLERLQDGMQHWGAGDLSVRVPESGRDEVAFLAQRFNQAAERIELLVQSRDALLTSQKSLLANASHELRSPLARIRMGVELLGTSASPTLASEITRNISELDQLIEEILLASRLDSLETDLGNVEALELIGLAAEECARVDAELDLTPLAAASQNASPVHELLVPGVAKLVRRALRNLLENAKRYAGDEIVLSLCPSVGAIEICVSDRGPGVPAELRERIFEPFFRLPGAAERDGGVGLGLALVKSIAQRHGGRAYCASRAGGGSSFVIVLPTALHEHAQSLRTK